MKPFLSIAALAAAATLACAPAHALTFEGSISQGATLVTPYVDTGLLSFDIDFANQSPVVLGLRIDAEDLLQPITFNAVLRNFTGLGIDAYVLSMDKGSFGTIGSVTRQFGGTTQIDVAGGDARLTFSSPEFLDIEIGNPLAVSSGAINWTLQGLQAGDRISLSISAVPEPETWGLLLAGLGVMGALGLRARRQG